MKLLTYSLAAGLLSASIASADYLKPLMNPAELSNSLDQANPIILDIRGDAYQDGHIPGAISAPYGLFRGPKNNPGQLLDEDVLEERFEALGLELDRPVVVVSEGKTDTDFGAAARVYWTLKSTGFEDLAILNGGKQAWEQAGYAIDKTNITPKPTELDITFSPQWTATTEQVVSVTKEEVDSLLLDARPASFYEGDKSHGAASRPGTLPGAENYYYASFFNDGSAAISSDIDVQALKITLGLEEDQEIVSFCNTGHWAATNWFALSEVAGIENVKLYPGSMVEYSNLDLPMENTPGVVENLLNSILGN
ncbi:MAG: rhodanese-like domain-containing protein [Tateyamaria sp.]|nr:rhodanese-like domain-containing protein [Tateyamaria sp.]MDG1419880.1 rhodanese-like domain-containing protein [Tateyamaria sp.]